MPAMSMHDFLNEEAIQMKKTVSIVFDIETDDYDDVVSASDCVELAKEMLQGMADVPGLDFEGKTTITCENVGAVLKL